MTKEQFLDGTMFTVGGLTYKGACTYSYNENAGCMMRQTRSSLDERIVMNEHECNVTKIGRVGFEGFAFVMKKKVVVKYRFSDLVLFEDQGPEYDGAGFSIEDREDDIEDQSHHCDDPSCNCSI